MRSVLLTLFLLGSAGAATAQTTGDLTGRVDRIEKELHAVQRKVFPGAAPSYFEPEITAPAAPPADTGAPASSPLSDLAQRVAAVEAQVRSLTGQSEIDGHRLDQLEQSFARMKADTEDRLGKLESGGAAASTATGGDTVPFGPSGRSPVSNAGRTGPTPPPAAAARGGDAGDTMASQAAADAGTGAPVPPAPAAAAVKTGDPAEDAYMAGYSLWSQKRYGDAEAALKDVVAKYPTHKRASYAQNLLGRAYMDDDQLTAAADAFLTGYKRFPRGDRAADSLYYLGVTLTRLKKQSQACQVYDELRDVYGATLNPTLKTRVTQGRADAKCGA